jgi:hypothetical protein
MNWFWIIGPAVIVFYAVLMAWNMADDDRKPELHPWLYWDDD